MTQQQYDELVRKYKTLEGKPEPLRVGQWLFIQLNDMAPEVVTQIASSKIDPFYQDNRLPEFFEALKSFIDE